MKQGSRSTIVIPDIAHYEQKITGIEQCATYNPPGPIKPGMKSFVSNMFVFEYKD